MPFAQLRSKTGCFKCRSRRKKCDEKHPRCESCSKWNFLCLWPDTEVQINEEEVLLNRDSLEVVGIKNRPGTVVERPHSESNELIKPCTVRLRPLPYGLRLSLEEREAFNFFHEQTSKTMTGVFRSVQGEVEIWSRMLLQGAQHDTSIKHAICALGALHQHLVWKSHEHGVEKYRLATKQYSKAIRCTIRSSQRKQLSLDAILVTCVLFTLLERLLGDFQTAMCHLRAGIKLLADTAVCTSNRAYIPQLANTRSYLPRKTIATLLRRLERQVFELGQTRLEADPTQTFAFDVCIPAAFASVEDASTSFEHYFNYAYHLMHTCEWRAEDQRQAQKPAEAHVMFFLRQTLARWTKAFKSFLHKTNHIRTSEGEQLIIHTLHLYRLVLTASLFHYQSGNEMLWDNFMPEFGEAVVHGAAIVYTHRRSANPGKFQDQPTSLESFVHDFEASGRFQMSTSGTAAFLEHPPPGTNQYINLEHPGKSTLTFSPFTPMSALFTIAFRCRDPVIRRQAMRLLQDIDWYDGFWDSKIESKLAERLIQIEENGYLMDLSCTRCRPPVERAEQILPAARCNQIRAQFVDSRTFVLDFISIPTNEWIPGPDYWEKPSPDAFHEVGRIRETWIASNYLETF